MSNLITRSSRDLLVNYLNILRPEFLTNSQVHDAIRAVKKATLARPALEDILCEHMLQDTEETFGQALDILLEEIEKSAGKQMLISTETGRPIMAYTEDMIYQPPDYVGEDGLVHRARPMLHPKIAAPMIMGMHKKGKLEKLEAKMGNSIAIEHLRNPDKIVKIASEILLSKGVELRAVDNGQTVTEKIGQENVEHIQSLNPSFHRVQMFGEILARRVLSHDPKLCEMGEAKECENSRLHWYEVKYIYQ